MDIIARESAKERKDIEPIPEGVHVATCYAIYDIGTQKKIWQDNIKWQPQVVICWELPEKRGMFEKDGIKQDLPRAISKVYALSLFKTAPLRKDLEAWRGKTFTDAELKGFSLKNVAGKSCLLQVVHKPKKEGSGVWQNVNAIMALPKGHKHEEPENPVVVWSILLEDKTINDNFDGVPDWIKNKALACKENLEAIPTEEAEPEEHQPDTSDMPF